MQSENPAGHPTKYLKVKAEASKRKQASGSDRKKKPKSEEKPMKNQHQNQPYESDDFDFDFEELFCETYNADDFETAVSDFNSELECESEDESEDDDTFENEDELEVWLEDHKNDDALLKEAWDSDLWNNSVSELATQSRLQFGVLNKAGIVAVLAQWQADLNGFEN